MQTKTIGLLRASALTACMFAVLPNVFAESTAVEPQLEPDPQIVANPQAVTNEELQTRLLNTLDNALGVANGIGMTEILGDQIEAARASVLSASPQELEEIPSTLYNSLKILEMSSGQMRLAYDPELQLSDSDEPSTQKSKNGMSIQSAGTSSGGATYDDTALADPGYPGQNWDFSFSGGELDGNADDVDGGSGGDHGSCHAPGTTYPARVVALNTAIVLNAVNDIAGHFCDWVIVVVGGGNFSPLCVVTQVLASVASGVDDNMSLCNEHVGAAEVSATWEGLKTVHGNVQHVHDDLADVDADIADVDADLVSHVTDITLQLSTHDADINTQVTNHDTAISTQVTNHDTAISTQVTNHDTAISTQVTNHDIAISTQVTNHDNDLKLALSIHDAEIKDRLGEIQGTVDENQRLITISMARQLEIIRLLLTPSGQREVNPDVLSCTGDDCPVLDDILSCKNGPEWPCK